MNDQRFVVQVSRKDHANVWLCDKFLASFPQNQHRIYSPLQSPSMAKLRL